MKNLLVTVFVLTFNILCHCQIDVEIYKIIIEDYVLKLRQPNIDYTLKTTLTFIDQPTHMDSLVFDDYPKFKKKYNNLDKDTFFDFINKNRQKVQLEKIDIPKIDIIVFNRDSVPNQDELISKYPNWIFSILEFSNVGINNEKNQALVYYGFNSGVGVGGGFYMVYEKKRRKWKQKGFIPAWAT